MDLITLASVTAAVSVLASECAKGIASAAGKDAWQTIKRYLGWNTEPALQDIPHNLATQIASDANIAAKIVQCLQADQLTNTSAHAFVGRIKASKVVVADQINVSGDWKM